MTTLWTVQADHYPTVVMAADHPAQARAIVSALVEHGDLPLNATTADLARCPSAQAGETLSLARSLGIGDRFLACLHGGLFFISIGGLSTHPDSLRTDQAA